MIKLQIMQLKDAEGKNRELYIRGNYSISDGACLLKADEQAAFDTYYNSLSASKWKKYTEIDSISFGIRYSGKIEMSIYHGDLEENEIVRHCLHRKELCCEETEELMITDLPLPDRGVIYPVFRCTGGVSKITDWYWYTEKFPRRQIRMALNICTFHREKEVRHNLTHLKQYCLENPESALYRNLEIFITDNGKSLQEYKEDSQVQYFENRNIGGTGGFTRGMTEILRQAEDKKITHLVFMDDDANIVISALELMQRFLEYMRPDFFPYIICGGLMRREMPWIQAEAGAFWKAGTITSVHGNYDMRLFQNVVKNEREDSRINYSGWWLSCVPADTATSSGLPLPLFLHRDDVEYGLRQKERFITLNGISIRHETYDTKLSQTTEYYDIRNMAIVESVQNPDFTKSEFKRQVIRWMAGNLLRYRYRYIQLNLKGAEDFLEGAQWLLSQDPEKLHSHIGRMCYRTYQGKTLPETVYYEKLIQSLNQSGGKGRLLISLLPFGNKKTGTLVPWQSVYDYSGFSKVTVTEFSGRSVTVEKKKGGIICFIRAVRRLLSITDEKFDKAKESYKTAYSILTSYETWSRQWHES